MNDQPSHDAGADDAAPALGVEALARFYDDTAAATGWLGPQVAFDLMRDHLRPGQTLLDLGIGTGLSSALFREAGLRVHGLDGDPEMLAVCRWKGFGDLVLPTWPRRCRPRARPRRRCAAVLAAEPSSARLPGC